MKEYREWGERVGGTYMQFKIYFLEDFVPFLQYTDFRSWLSSESESLSLNKKYNIPVWRHIQYKGNDVTTSIF